MSAAVTTTPPAGQVVSTVGIPGEVAHEELESHLHPAGSYDPADHPVPTGREEVWRFTPLRRLRSLHVDAPFAGDALSVEVEAVAPVTVTTLPGQANLVKGISGYAPTDRVSARAWAAPAPVLHVRVPADAVVEGATVVTVRGDSAERAVAGHVVIEAERFSSATVVLVHEGSATLADNVEIVVGDGASLTLVSVQDWADDAVHLTHHHARMARDGAFKHVAVSFGGDVVRMNASVGYDAPGGQVDMFGLYFADAGQHLEHRLFVDHNAPHTRSNVDYKGALQGQGAHTVWIGDVLIRKVAEGIKTYESNRNLVLSDGARADSVPNLEIETGEILGAGHASTTGRFDEEQLFYLRSRGISEEEARRLVVRGFFNDIIHRIGVPALESRLLAAVEAELAAVGVA